MKKLGSVTLETKRLILRKQKIEDAEMIFNNCGNDNRITNYLFWNSFKNVEATTKDLSKTLAEDDNLNAYRWGIVLKENKEMIGSIRVISIEPDTDSLEIGFMLSKKYWGNQYTSEALTRVMEFLFKEAEAKTIWASYDIDNPECGRMLKSCGLVYFRDSYGRTTINPDGLYRDFKITKEQYNLSHSI